MEYGEIVKFEVTARCPYCDEETEVSEIELVVQEVCCQHCDSAFRVTPN